MQLGPNLKFQCLSCDDDICFSVTEISRTIICRHCEAEYEFSEELLDKLEKFSALCIQIRKSKDILGASSITVEVGQEKTVLPFNFLLTSFPVSLTLQMQGKTINVLFLMNLNESNYCKTCVSVK